MKHKCDQMGKHYRIIYNNSYLMFFLEKYKEDHDCWGRDESGYSTLCSIKFCPFCGKELRVEE